MWNGQQELWHEAQVKLLAQAEKYEHVNRGKRYDEKSDKTQITIARIVEAAIKEFGENGCAGGTMNHICRAGVNKGLVYHNFAGKETLYLTCVQHSCNPLTEYIEQHGGTAGLQ